MGRNVIPPDQKKKKKKRNVIPKNIIRNVITYLETNIPIQFKIWKPYKYIICMKI